MDQPIHTLGDYVSLLEQKGLLAAPAPNGLDLQAPVALVAYDSRQVVPGTLFLCKGARFKPEFLAAAKEQGALAYLSAIPYPQVDLPCLLTGDMRRAIAPLADLYYNHPSRGLKVVGITGTKGKSSTAYYLKYIFDEHLLRQGKPESGIISSIDTYDGAARFESHITTPEPLELQRHFQAARNAGLEYLTMEVSSQALKYHRTLCTRFAAACFLNIGADHISPIEHPDFEDYFASKLKIFAQAEVCCVNLDCEHSQRIVQTARAAGRPVYTFSQRDMQADVFASQVRKQGGDILFRVDTRAFSRQFRLTMPGLFNVENALAAIAVCQSLNIPQDCIYVGLMKARVPGRMEVYSNADETVTAIVDYAHNRMSFETLFRSAKMEYPGRRIVSVFGCPGKKALDRRRELGEISGRHADLVVLTEEDSGEEDTLSICREIAAHVTAQGCRCSIEPNRGEAIRQAILSCAGHPSILLITGKGAETRQKRGTEYIETVSDVDYAHTFLQEYDLSRGLDGMQRIRALLSVLPALKQVRQQLVLVSYGLPAQAEPDAHDTVLQDVAALTLMDVPVVVLHAPDLSCPAALARLTQENQMLVTRLTALGVRAAGLSGAGSSLHAAGRTGADMELRADAKPVNTLLAGGFVPVISPTAASEDGSAMPCNAGEAAHALAKALGADRLLFLTRLGGICLDGQNEKTAVSRMDMQRAEELLRAGLVSAALVPVVQTCIRALRSGTGQTAILPANAERSLLLELLDQRPQGTVITGEPPCPVQNVTIPIL